ncbi:MAG: porin [Acetobacter sp.]|nr:porin [Acetobacter sp.]
MKILPLLMVLSATPAMTFAGTFETDYNATLGGFYGYTDYSKKYSSLHKQNNFNSTANFYGRVSYIYNPNYTTSLIGYAVIDSAKKIENYNQGMWGEELYLSQETPYGDILIGQNNNVAYEFAVGAPNIGSYHINNTELVNFIANPNWYKRGHNAAYKTLNSTYINTDGASLKVSYITPEFSGIKLGGSFIPETYSQSGLVAKNAPYKDKSAYVLGVYGAWDIVGYEVETSLGFAEYYKNDKEYSAGISIYRKGWTLGASYRQTEANKKYYALNKENLYDAYREGRAYNVGLSYAIGPLTTGIAYFDSKADKSQNRNKIISFSNSYEYSKNITFSLTAAHIEAIGENNNVSNNSKGYAFILGMELSL